MDGNYPPYIYGILAFRPPDVPGFQIRVPLASPLKGTR